MDTFDVHVNKAALFSLDDHHIKVLEYMLHADMLENDLKRRLGWVIMHKYKQCFERMKKEWDKKLAANGVTMIPTDEKKYVNLVCKQPNYKDRKARDAEAHKEEVSIRSNDNGITGVL